MSQKTPTGMVSKIYESQLRETFQAFDTMGKGSVSTKDLRHILQALDMDATPPALRQLCEELDPESAGQIQYQTFLRVMRPKMMEKGAEGEIKKVFQLFDRSGTGKISKRDLELVAEELNETIPLEELGEMISMADRDGDGLVDLYDFTMVMKKTKLF
ncbi:heterotrimeric G-protein binding [Dimargaris xerosporica]|nr:heterotrimeric G-protein binding [Dimargaris xerosporica]